MLSFALFVVVAVAVLMLLLLLLQLLASPSARFVVVVVVVVVDVVGGGGIVVMIITLVLHSGLVHCVDCEVYVLWGGPLILCHSARSRNTQHAVLREAP